MRIPATLLSLTLLGLLTWRTEAQPLTGVVWSPPADPSAAGKSLAEIRATGLRAVRLPALALSEELLSHADSLEITVFADLPTGYLPAAELADSLGSLSDLLLQLSLQANRHASLRYVGLAIAPGPGLGAACAAIRSASGLVRAASPLRSYMVVWRDPDGTCDNAVDLVLAERPDFSFPDQVLTESGRYGGVGAWGRWVAPDAASGLSIARSEERQAIHFEEKWGLVQHTSLEVVFWYRWSDANAGDRRSASAPFERRFGVIGEDGAPRRVHTVLTGLLGGSRAAFEYPGGAAPGERTPGIRVVGWILILSIVSMLVLSARFRVLVPRYFVAHGFYRQAIDEARDLVAAPTALLLVTHGITVGILAGLIVQGLSETAPGRLIWEWAPYPGRLMLSSLVNRPLAGGILSGSAAMAALGLWATAWIGATMRRRRLRSMQTFSMAVWARWQMVALLVAAMILSENAPEDNPLSMAILGACWIGAAVWGSWRAQIDMARVGRMSAVLTAPLWLLSPPGLALLALMALVLNRGGSLGYYLSLIAGG